MTPQEAITVMEIYKDITLSKVTKQARNMVIEAHNMAIQALEKQAEYKSLEEQGLLLRLPCKVKTPVYMVATDCGGDTLDCRRGECEGCPYLYSFVEENAFDTYMVDDVGKTVFLTKEEAEAALEKMKGGVE